MTKLFHPIRLRELDIPNRVWMAPMCQYSAIADGPRRGSPSEWHMTHLSARAVGGVGLAMVEATAVRPEGRISPLDLGLWSDEQQEAFERLVVSVERHGAVPGIQLAHAGAKASTKPPWNGHHQALDGAHAWTTVAPSSLAFGDLPMPCALTPEEIQAIVEAFASAAIRAREVGFQVVEIHGAHGYLVHSFLSPYTNRRTDHYGGSFENRIRFAVEIIDAVRAVWPDELPVVFRVSATDWLSENPSDSRQGWTAEDTLRLAPILLAHGVDLLDVSSGGLVPDAAIPSHPSYQVPFAALVRQQSDLAVSAVGLITDPRQAATIVDTGQADAVMLGRELLRDPYWPRKAAQCLGERPRWPVQYSWAI